MGYLAARVGDEGGEVGVALVEDLLAEGVVVIFVVEGVEEGLDVGVDGLLVDVEEDPAVEGGLDLGEGQLGQHVDLSRVREDAVPR